MGVVVLCGLTLVQGCGSVGDENAPQASAEPVVGTPSEAVAPPVGAAVAVEAAQAEESGAVVKLALTFVPGRTTTYKVTTETEKRVKWEGNMTKKPAAFKAGRTGYHVEMTFDQQVGRLDDNGHAAVKVTIKALKYSGQVHGQTVLDFDSAKSLDKDSPMAALIGQSYRLQMTPRGQVIAVIDVGPAREAVEGVTAAHRTAAKLLSEKAIRQRHEVAALTALESDTVRPAAHWSKAAAFSFAMLGAKVYERVYTLQGVEGAGDTQEAVVVMKAIPSAAGAGAEHQGQAVNPLVGMFDTTDSYEGQLRFDLKAGQVGEYFERLETEWVIADPAAIQTGDANPAVLRMGATESFKLERVD